MADPEIVDEGKARSQKAAAKKKERRREKNQ
jgi:hypothetical protein